MADTTNRAPEQSSEVTSTPAVEDPRKPYEPPRLLKKRSVARATLFTVMGPTMSGLTMTG
jgi:hypothetical protein